jgi:hypothetical protein
VGRVAVWIHKTILRMERGQIIGLWWEDYVVLNRFPPKNIPRNSIHPKEELKIDNNKQQDIITAEYICSKMKDSILALKSEHISSNGDQVNYSMMKSSPLFAQYLETSQLLHQLDLSILSSTERKAFFINIYNSLVIHSLVENMITENDDSIFKRLRMYATAAYQIGPFLYSLNDIEHGILRGNKCSPTPFSSPPFPSHDPRLRFIVEFDPRIHFTLNCGARSCPIIKVYLDSKLDRQLQSATQCYLTNIAIDLQQKTVTLSMLFKWFRHDFGNNDLEILRWIELHATDDVARPLHQLLEDINLKKKKKNFFSSSSSSWIHVKYFPYDWRINS